MSVYSLIFKYKNKSEDAISVRSYSNKYYPMPNYTKNTDANKNFSVISKTNNVNKL